MASPDERDQKIAEAKNLLSELSEQKATNLSREEELSRDINFSEAVPHFEQLLEVIKQLNERNIDRLAFPHLNQIISSGEKLKVLVEKVKNFTINQNRPADVCKSIVTEIAGSYDAIMEPLTLPLAFTATQATDYAKIEREAKGYHVTMRDEADLLRKQLQAYKSEAESALQAVKDQAAEAGVSTNAQIFLKDSKEHSDAANTWLIWTIIMAVALLLAAAIFVYVSYHDDPKSTAYAIQFVVSKIIFLSALSFGLFWSARNYKASKHNETLNKHRANALMTFRAFVEGSSDVQVKEAILLQAAQAAFINRPTGFESGEREPQGINPVVEILSKSARRSDAS